MTTVPEAREYIAQRYRRVREVGRGGVGEVIEVFDETRQLTLALKRLLPSANPRNREQLESLFRNEYSTLAQFAHPNVVKVYDFGVDAGTPFYTMELVSGEHPGAGSPMPWRDVCRLLVALCAPLTLLHSRGWVHRDIAPRNVYILPDGSPRLIDFGIIAALDEAHRPMGTPACMAPETWRRQRIDARTDIYALGALGYCALTGRHAYPARAMEQLPLLWQTPPPKPADLVPSIPDAISELILSMLCLEMSARPRQVAEVVARLIAVADLPVDGELQLAQACLTSPGLVGREQENEHLHDLLHWAHAGQTATCVVRGERGSGCTRLLDALAVDAKVLGYVVMRANATHHGRREFGVTQELARTSWQNDAEHADEVTACEAALLRAAAADSGESERLEAQRVFIALCEQYNAARPLLIVVDDAANCDLESLRLLSRLQQRAGGAGFLLVCSQRPGHTATAIALQTLLSKATVIELGPLDGRRIESLLRALFGDVPNLARVATWIQQTSGGQFAACIAGARALVDAGLAHFVAGSWQLPDRLDNAELAADVQRALDQRIQRLSPHATALLQLLSLVNDPPAFALPRYRCALPASEAELMAAEGELFTSHVLVASSSGYVVRDAPLLQRLRTRMPADAMVLAHERLARFHVQENKPLRAAYHFWRAGQLDAADEQLSAGLDWRGQARDLQARVFARSHAALPLFEVMLVHRKQRGRAPVALFPLRAALLALAAMHDAELAHYAPETIAQLQHDAGLDFWKSADPSEPALQRIVGCLALAKQRYELTAPEHRGLTPELSVSGIAGAVVSLTGVYTVAYDVAGTARLVRLIEPLRSLSPVLELVGILCEHSLQSVRFDANVRALRQRTMDATAVEMAGLPDEERDTLYKLALFYQGLELAVDGQPAAIELADALQVSAAYQPLALQVRRMHALYCGDFEAAQRYRRERELLPFLSEASDQHLQTSVLREMTAAHSCRDLLELSRCSDGIEARAARFEGWQPWAALARGLLLWLSDEPAAASAVMERAIAALTPFGHAAWLHLIRARAEAQNTLRQFADAKRALLELLEGVRERGLQVERLFQVEVQLGIAEAGCGERTAGLARLDRLLAEVGNTLGRNNLQYGGLCEARCQAALIVKDYTGFSRYLDEMAAVYANHPSLRARHARWVRAGEARFQKLLALLSAADARATWSNRLVQHLPGQNVAHQGEYLLSVVLDELGITAGHMFRIVAKTLQLMAARPSRPDPTMLRAADRHFARWLASDEHQTDVDETFSGSDDEPQPECALAPLWLTHPNRPEEPIGLVLLVCSIELLAQLTPAFVRALTEHLETLPSPQASALNT